MLQKSLPFVLALVLTGCPGDPKPEESHAPAAVASVGVATSPGEEVFKKRCQSCHGQNGQGGMGPSLVKVGTRLKDGVIDQTIKQGRPTSGMPAFEGVLLPADIDAVKGFIKGL